jgi:hypothetical protein
MTYLLGEYRTLPANGDSGPVAPGTPPAKP